MKNDKIKRVLIAVDAFKGTLSSKTIAELIKKHHPFSSVKFDEIYLSDGGEGFVEAIKHAKVGQAIYLDVKGPYLEKVFSSFFMVEQTAYMDVASSSGLSLVKKEDRNPLLTTTYGLGEMMLSALNHGANTLVIGIGGSSSHDGGAGMLKAIGVKFYDKNHNEIDVMNGQSLADVETIDISMVDQRLLSTKIIIASDVKNPLLGQHGASYTYAEQKGADKLMLDILEKHMKHYARVVKKTLGCDYKSTSGAGAAGGLGFAFKSFLKADIKSGFNLVSSAYHLEKKMHTYDFIITGEGQLDQQSYQGKAAVEVAKLAKKHGKRVIGLFGMVKEPYKKYLFDQIFSVVPDIAEFEDSLNHPKQTLIELIHRMKSLEL